MKQLFCTLSIALIIISSSFSAIAAKDIKTSWHISEKDLKNAKSANYHAIRNDWKNVRKFSYKIKDKTLRKIFQWREYYSKSHIATFAEITQFIRENPNWPKIDILEKRAEEAINDTTTHEEIVNWFTAKKNSTGAIKFSTPLTSIGKQHLAEAAITIANKINVTKKSIDNLIKDSWINGNFKAKEEWSFLTKHKTRLNLSDYIERIERLLWIGDIISAQRIIDTVPDGHKRLFSARIALQTQNFGVDLSVKKVPKELLNDEGLLFDRASWRQRRGTKEGVIEILKQSPANTNYPEKWWKLKSKYLGYLQDKGDFSTAYLLASHHGFKNNIINLAKAEWLAGWIAYSQMQDYRKAYTHFYTLYSKVATPISLGRASFWAAMAAEKNKNLNISNKWLMVASKYPTSFYGQIATARLGQRTLTLPKDPLPSWADTNSYNNNELIKSAYILRKLERHGLATTFLLDAIKKATTSGEKLLASRTGQQLERPDYGVLLAKEAAKHKGPVLAEAYYPLIPMKGYKGKNITAPEHALIHSIILQESIFKTNVKSPAGALGLMQVMPPTAKEQARKLKIPYRKKHLTFKPEYNLTIGSNYLDSLIKRFDGSYILAIASYNGGQGNVRKWLKKYGDPRKLKDLDSILYWIENIPFYETRNYVQRVMENLQLYRYMLNKNHPPYVNILDDLSR